MIKKMNIFVELLYHECDCLLALLQASEVRERTIERYESLLRTATFFLRTSRRLLLLTQLASAIPAEHGSITIL